MTNLMNNLQFKEVSSKYRMFNLVFMKV